MDECDEVAVWLLTGGQPCWRCGDWSGVMLGVDVAGIGVVDAGEDVCEELAGDKWVPIRMRLGSGPLRPRWSNTAGRSYWSQGCLHCDALFGQWPLREALHEAATRHWEGVGRVGPISVPLWVVARWASD